MKNRMFLLMAGIVFAAACNEKMAIESSSTQIPNSQNEVLSAPNLGDENKIKIHFVFRWHGLEYMDCPCPNCVCPQCPCPIGVCACWTISRTDEPVPPQYDTMLASADVYFLNDSTIRMIFDQETSPVELSNNGNDYVPISGNATFSQALCSHFGVESVILPSGNYLLTRSGSGSYGYIDIHAIIEE